MRPESEIIGFKFKGDLSFHKRKGTQSQGFSLIELLTVLSIVVTLMAFSGTAIRNIKGSSDFSRATEEVSGALERARAYAMAKNTYVWVGFYEEDSMASGSTNSLPPYTGRGRLLVATVASLDGTKIFEESADAANLPSTKIVPVGKLTLLRQTHLTDVGEPEGGEPLTLAGRPGEPYEDSESAANRISSDSSEQTPFPFEAFGYTFYKTIRFSPSGEASINGVYPLRRIGEIGLVPARGTQTESVNKAAIQFNGISGNIRIYRQ